jgi:hypothetical protein
MNIMQSSSVLHGRNRVITIAFDSEDDRVRGFNILLRSNKKFDGIGKNKFLISSELSGMLTEKNIRFSRIH